MRPAASRKPGAFCALALAILVATSVLGTGASRLAAQTLPLPPPEPPSPASAGATSEAPPSAPRPPYDPLLDLPPLPHNKVSLLGGTVTSLDEVENGMVVRPFGGKQKIHLHFDVRTRFIADGKPAAERDIHLGQRVYVDTMLNGTKVFAKSIWIQAGGPSGSGRGQVLSFNHGSGVLTLRDEVSSEPVSFHLSEKTVIRSGEAAGTIDDLKPGALVSLSFGPQQGKTGTVEEVAVLAAPGAAFTFRGKITFFDISLKLLALSNRSDDKNYDLYLQLIPDRVLKQLREGTDAAITAIFDGTHYVAQKVEIVQSTGSSDKP